MNILELLFQNSLATHSTWIIGLSFLGGIISSLLPCTVGMLPILVGYVGAYESQSRTEILVQVTLFVLGVATVMTALGVTAGLLGMTFGSLIGDGWFYVIGVLAFLVGLQMLEVIHLPLPPGLSKLPSTQYGKLLTPYILGITFGVTASPCGTPFLAGILGLIAHGGNVLVGGASLFVYAVGQGVLLIAAGLFTGLLKHMTTFRQVGSVLSKVSAVVFILAGLFFIVKPTGLLDHLFF